MSPDPPAGELAFGDLLRQHRRSRELTQELLADCAGVSVRAISDLERGARVHPYRETAILLANALELNGPARSEFLAAAQRPTRQDRSTASQESSGRLPSPITHFIGRDDDLAFISTALRDERTRLLTLTGPAGVGKTRLALAAAASLHDAFRDGIRFVDLAPLQDASLVLPAMAASLGLRDHGPIPLLEAVRGLASTRRILLVVDNFEHLLEAAPIVSDVVQCGPGIQVLITSRAALRLRGEHEYPVLPLPTPQPGAKIPWHQLSPWPVIRLFLDRAAEARPGFQLTEANAQDVLAICHRLDGLPLAIELAAARVKFLSPTALLARLEQRLPLLTSGMRDAPHRQRTLEAAIAWSYDLLSPDERTLFRCLGVFVGGWTLEAAEAIGRDCGVADVLGALAALVDQSLVFRVDEAEPRYRMLETVREFAEAQLVAAADEERVRRVHLQHFLQFVQENDLEPINATTDPRRIRLEQEEANLRAAILWAISHDPETALQLVAALGYFWFLTDRPVAGRDLLERVLSSKAGPAQPARARALQQAAWLSAYLGDFAAAEPLAEAALRLAEHLGETRTIAHVLVCQGHIAKFRGDASRAQSLFAAALAHFEALDDVWGLIFCLSELGIAALHWGDALGSVAYFERVGGLVAEHQAGSRNQAHYLVGLANAYYNSGQQEAAMAACTDVLALAEDAAMISTRVGRRLLLARLMLDREEIDQAVALAGQALVDFWEIGFVAAYPDALETAAAVAAAGRHVTAATRLLGAAAALRDAMPCPMDAGEGIIHERRLAELRAALGEPAFPSAWRAGQRRPLAASVADARQVLAMLALQSVE